MRRTNKIKNFLEINYNLKGNKYEYFPKTNKELRELIDVMIFKNGYCVDLNNVCVSYINDFEYIFSKKIFFNGDVSEWDVCNSLDFHGMFYDCRKFNSNLSDWDVSNGEYFNYTICGCKSFNSNLSEWDISNAKSWIAFAEGSLLEKYPERIPKKFRNDYL
jgi:surface protein